MKPTALIALLVGMWGWTCSLLPAAGPTYDDPAHVDQDYPFQGEYRGTLQTSDGPQTYGVQVIALGEGKFRAVAYPGGLPGDGWDGQQKLQADGERNGTQVVLRGEAATATIRDGQLQVEADDCLLGTLERVERQSPTLGEKPPAGAMVLFDGSDVQQWQNGRMTDEGLLMQGTTSKPKFQSQRLHIEFRLPYQPHERGQARGNSGIYLQGRYEVQMLDSFGLEGKDNECGGIYSIAAPRVNMCLPPLQWQTYDIEFTAAQFNDQGQMTAPARITVFHNGEKIHDNVPLPRTTTAAPVPLGPEPGPVYLQDHGNPVRYRNIWVVSQ